jgi:hypothetical protein
MTAAGAAAAYFASFPAAAVAADDGCWPQLAPAYLWSEIKDAKSKLAPYLKTLPARSQMWSYYTIPESYLPLIQNDAVVSHLRGDMVGIFQF